MKATTTSDLEANRRVRVAGLWSDSLGKVATRSLQLLLIGVLIWAALVVLAPVKVVVLAVLVAVILSCAVRPPVSWLERHGWSSALAAVTVFVGLLVILGGVITGVVYGIRGGWSDLSSAAGEGWKKLQEYVENGPLPIPVDSESINSALSQVKDAVTSASAQKTAISGLSTATEAITGAVLAIIVLFFFLKDGPRIGQFFLRWFRGETREKIAESGRRGVTVLGGYVRGVALIALVDALFIGIGLWIVGVPLVIPLSVIVFITAFIPIVGALFAGTLAALVALVANGPVPALIVIAIAFAVNHLEGYFLQPVVMGHTLQLNGLVVLLALSAGSIVGGIAGAVLAIPLVAVAWRILPVWTDRYEPESNQGSYSA